MRMALLLVCAITASRPCSAVIGASPSAQDKPLLQMLSFTVCVSPDLHLSYASLLYIDSQILLAKLPRTSSQLPLERATAENGLVTQCNPTSFMLTGSVQAFNSSSGLVMKGSASILSGLQLYQAKEWVLRSWRDVFVDRVQGQLQFLSLLAGEKFALNCHQAPKFVARAQFGGLLLCGSSLAFVLHFLG